MAGAQTVIDLMNASHDPGPLTMAELYNFGSISDPSNRQPRPPRSTAQYGVGGSDAGFSQPSSGGVAALNIPTITTPQASLPVNGGGALSSAADYSPDESESAPVVAPLNVAAQNPDLVSTSRTSSADSPGPATQYLMGLSKSLAGGAPDGALSKLDSLDAARDKASAGKMAAIQKAMKNLQDWQSNRSNLTSAAFGTGLLQNTHGGGLTEALGNGFSAALPVARQEQQMNLETTRALDQLGVSAADVDLQNAAAAQKEVMDRYKLAVDAGKAAAVPEGYGIRADAMRDVAAIRAQSVDDKAATDAIVKKYGVDARTAVGMLNAAANQTRADAATTNSGANVTRAGAAVTNAGANQTRADAATIRANKMATLTPNEQASMRSRAQVAAQNDPRWTVAKTNADRDAIFQEYLDRNLGGRSAPLLVVPRAPSAVAPAASPPASSAPALVDQLFPPK